MDLKNKRIGVIRSIETIVGMFFLVFSQGFNRMGKS